MTWFYFRCLNFLHSLFQHSGWVISWTSVGTVLPAPTQRSWKISFPLPALTPSTPHPLNWTNWLAPRWLQTLRPPSLPPHRPQLRLLRRYRDWSSGNGILELSPSFSSRHRYYCQDRHNGVWIDQCMYMCTTSFMCSCMFTETVLLYSYCGYNLSQIGILELTLSSLFSFSLLPPQLSSVRVPHVRGRPSAAVREAVAAAAEKEQMKVSVHWRDTDNYL